jgi:carbonic anhydrase/acetyltransferase-like protein (isoleucine patch superfamily)
MIREIKGKSPRIAASAFVSEAAYVVGDVEIGENSSVWPGAVIRADFGKITIGHNTSVEDNTVIHGDGDVYIGNNNVIGHAAVVHCRRVGNNVLIGNNATILDGSEIEDYCIIGAGCLIPPNTKVTERSVVIGVPGHVKSQLTEEQETSLNLGAAGYSALAQGYKQKGL